MGGCQSHFRNSAQAVAEHANPRRIEIVQAKWHLLGQFGDDLPHRCPRLADVAGAENLIRPGGSSYSVSAEAA